MTTNYFTEEYFQEIFTEKDISRLQEKYPKLEISREYLGEVAMYLFEEYQGNAIVVMNEPEQPTGYCFAGVCEDLEDLEGTERLGKKYGNYWFSYYESVKDFEIETETQIMEDILERDGIKRYEA